MVNKAILLGRLGKDPVVRHTESGNSVATFSIATGETYTDKEGNRQERTEWHNIVVWSRLAEIAGNYLNKGSLVYIEGRITSRSYQAQDGSTKYITEIVANTLRLMPKTMNSGGSSVPLPPEDQAPRQTSSNVIDSAPNTNTSNTKSTLYAEVKQNEEADDLPF